MPIRKAVTATVIEGGVQKRRKGNETKDLITEINKPYQFPDSDVVLICSDGLKFKVHSHYLKSSSTVFASMMEIGDDKQSHDISLTDKNIEHSSILVLYLHLAYGNDLDFTKENRQPSNNDKRCHLLISFLLKYDAKTPMQTLKYALRLCMMQDCLSPLTIFLVGSKVDDIELCVESIKQTPSWGWTAKKDATEDETQQNSITLTKGLWGGQSFDMTTVSLKTMKAIPTVYLCALLRASHEAVKATRNEQDWEKIATKFGEIMKDHKKSKQGDKAASVGNTVLQSTLERGGDTAIVSEIAFPDPDIETSDVPRFFLDLVYCNEVRIKTGDVITGEARKDNDQFRNGVARVLTKYKADPASQTFRYGIKLWLRDQCFTPNEVFITGTLLSSTDLCATAIRHGERWSWELTDVDDADGIHAAAHQASLLDVSASPLWALLRASRVNDILVLRGTDCNNIADKFEQLIRYIQNENN
ncbi:hypothetical protein CI109_105230 [Kwoniella shandongensis]|uniref:BTB domain-containing protein n=1 Tax=Kwoniella shandongensis TaxID=1734106 RepID=A0AAJ8MYU0_9TREE